MVDTGIHAMRWSREEAVDYMLRNTGMVRMIKLLELRDYAKAELGDRFDIREFHNVVLTNGSVPLDILEQLAREYVAAKKG